MIGFIASRISSRAMADTPADKESSLNAGGTQTILQEPRSHPCLVLRQQSGVLRKAVSLGLS